MPAFKISAPYQNSVWLPMNAICTIWLEWTCTVVNTQIGTFTIFIWNDRHSIWATGPSFHVNLSRYLEDTRKRVVSSWILAVIWNGGSVSIFVFATVSWIVWIEWIFVVSFFFKSCSFSFIKTDGLMFCRVVNSSWTISRAQKLITFTDLYGRIIYFW